jgi:hypothetical protein
MKMEKIFGDVRGSDWHSDIVVLKQARFFYGVKGGMELLLSILGIHGVGAR